LISCVFAKENIRVGRENKDNIFMDAKSPQCRRAAESLEKIKGKNIFFPEIQVGFNLSHSILKAFRNNYST
jgi:hypothetical protein